MFPSSSLLAASFFYYYLYFLDKIKIEGDKRTTKYKDKETQHHQPPSAEKNEVNLRL